MRMREHTGQRNKRVARSTETGSGSDGIPPLSMTLVIRHDVRAGTADQYEAWLNHIISVEQRFPGQGGVNIIRAYEGSERYAMLLRFDTLEYLQA